MQVLEGQTVITKPWKNRKKYQTYVFNEEARSILTAFPREIISESLEERTTINPKVLHFFLSYGKILQIIIDTLYQSKGKYPSQAFIDQCFEEGKKSMSPKLDWTEKGTHEVYFETVQEVLRKELKSLLQR